MLSNCFMWKILLSNLILRLLMVGILPYSFLFPRFIYICAVIKHTQWPITSILRRFFHILTLLKSSVLTSMACYNVIGKIFFFLSVSYNHYLNFMKYVKCRLIDVWHKCNYILWAKLSFHILHLPKEVIFLLLSLWEKSIVWIYWLLSVPPVLLS